MFKLPPLPFANTALEPAMSKDTLDTHHGKHHAAYIKKTNDLLQEKNWGEASLEDVVRKAHAEADQKLFNQAAQAWNHAFFWQSLTPNAEKPAGDLKQALERGFGSIDAFRDEFLAKGESHFASGWLWLCQGADGALALIDLHDAQTPIVDSGVKPLFVTDLWEHAYYLDHKNARRAFLETVFDKLANWSFAERQLNAARGHGEAWRFADTQN
ncbi:MAG: superoxide dismutase [Hyphomonadaceae bacterium]